MVGLDPSYAQVTLGSHGYNRPDRRVVDLLLESSRPGHVYRCAADHLVRTGRSICPGKPLHAKGPGPAIQDAVVAALAYYRTGRMRDSLYTANALRHRHLCCYLHRGRYLLRRLPATTAEHALGDACAARGRGGRGSGKRTG